jgi:hypothetical protein
MNFLLSSVKSPSREGKGSHVHKPVLSPSLLVHDLPLSGGLVDTICLTIGDWGVITNLEPQLPSKMSLFVPENLPTLSSAI